MSLVQDPWLETEGRRIYQENRHFRAFANVLNHPEFQTFLEEYLVGDDCQLSVMIIQLFMELRKKCKKELGQEPSPYQLIAMVKRMIDNSETRRWLVERSMNRHRSNDGHMVRHCANDGHLVHLEFDGHQPTNQSGVLSTPPPTPIDP
jgi:phage major head subunit gpT-like protein